MSNQNNDERNRSLNRNNNQNQASQNTPEADNMRESGAKASTDPNQNKKKEGQY